MSPVLIVISIYFISKSIISKVIIDTVIVAYKTFLSQDITAILTKTLLIMNLHIILINATLQTCVLFYFIWKVIHKQNLLKTKSFWVIWLVLIAISIDFICKSIICNVITGIVILAYKTFLSQDTTTILIKTLLIMNLLITLINATLQICFCLLL